MLKKTIVIGFVCLLVSAFAVAKLQIVRLKGPDGELGGSIIGEVTEIKDGYSVKVGSGSSFTFTKDQVASIEDYLTPADEYLKRREEVGPSEPEQLIALARWGYSHKEVAVLKLALEDVAKAAKLLPDSEEAEILSRRIKAKINKITATTSGSKGGKPKARQPRIPDDWLVSKQDITRSRLAEVKIKGSRDKRIGVIFHNDVIGRFIENMEGEDGFDSDAAIKEFRSMKPVAQLRVILDRI